jgi:hypothetical protein
MLPCVNILTLKISCSRRDENLEQQFWSSSAPSLIMTQLDLAGIVSSMVINLIVTRFLYVKNGQWWQPFAMVFISLAQMIVMLMHKQFYRRNRTTIQVMQRLLRLLPAVDTALSYHQNRSKFLTMANSVTVVNLWRSLSITTLVEPMLVAVSTFNYILPHRLQLIMCSMRLALDLSYGTPAIGCLLQHLRLGPVVNTSTSILQTVAFVLFSPTPAWPEPPTADTNVPFIFLPAFMYVSIAALLPTVGTYWIESHQKRQFLASRGFVEAAGASCGLSTKVLLAMQLYLVLAISYLIAVGTAWLHAPRFPAHCSRLMRQGGG